MRGAYYYYNIRKRFFFRSQSLSTPSAYWYFILFFFFFRRDYHKSVYDFSVGVSALLRLCAAASVRGVRPGTIISRFLPSAPPVKTTTVPFVADETRGSNACVWLARKVQLRIHRRAKTGAFNKRTRGVEKEIERERDKRREETRSGGFGLPIQNELVIRHPPVRQHACGRYVRYNSSGRGDGDEVASSRRENAFALCSSGARSPVKRICVSAATTRRR